MTARTALTTALLFGTLQATAAPVLAQDGPKTPMGRPGQPAELASI